MKITPKLMMTELKLSDGKCSVIENSNIFLNKVQYQKVKMQI